MGEQKVFRAYGLKTRFLSFLSIVLLLSTASVYAYTPSVTPNGTAMRWARPVKLNLVGNPSNLSGLTPQDFLSAVVKSLQRWKYGSSEQITFDYWQGTDPSEFPTTGELDGVSTLSFASISGLSPQLSSRVLGLTQVWYNSDTGEILEADIALNDRDYIFTLDPRDSSRSGNRVYIQNVITHELGHAYGLSHSGNLQASMLFTETREQAHLSCDDQAGIHALYPPPGRSETGTLQGHIQAPNAEAVFGAHVVAISERRGVAVASSLTDPEGNFTIDALEPDSYLIYAEPFYAGSAALPTFYSKIDFRFCPNGKAFHRSFLFNHATGGKPGMATGQLKSTPVHSGLISDVGTLSVECESVQNSSDRLLLDGTKLNPGSFGKVDRFGQLPDFQLYRLNAISGFLDVHALAYSLYSPLRVSLSLLSTEGATVASEIQNPIYRGDSGYINYDSSLTAQDLPFGDYWLKVAGERLLPGSYPASGSLDRVPFFILTGKWNQIAPHPTFPRNARCTMQEDAYPKYQSPPGRPSKNNENNSSHTGFCGGLSTSHDRDDPPPPPNTHAGADGWAILGWFLAWTPCLLPRIRLPVTLNSKGRISMPNYQNALICALFLIPSLAYSEIRPEKIFVADSKKNELYRKEGLITGGDRTISDVIIKDIRRAVNPGQGTNRAYERVVIDLTGTRNGESAAIPRPPYYQLAMRPSEKRILISIWGKPQLAFDSRKVMAAFHKSSVVSQVSLLPKIEDDLWTFSIDLKQDSSVEVFELTTPVRLIVDIAKKRTGGT